MELEVLNVQKELIRKVDVSILNIKDIRYDLIHQLVVWQLAKKRNVISHTKGVSEVKGSTRKIYKQKGTGRARHGSNRRVQFRGGGIVFGPDKNKVFQYKLNKKVRKIALLNALSLKLKEKSIKVHECFEIKDSKTKTFINMYNCHSSCSKKVLFIDNSFSEDFVKSAKNLYNVNRLPTAGINVLDLIKHNEIHFSEDALKNVLERLK